MVTPTLTSTLISPAVYDGYNLIGNPYPSSTDWSSAGWVRTNVDPVKYSFNINQYQTYNAVTGESTNGGDKYVRPEQGFFVHVTDNTPGTVSVDNSARVHTTGAYNKNASSISDQLVLTATANGIDDEAHVVFSNDATLNFDPELDAYKMTGSTQTPNLFSMLPAGITAAVNWLPRTGTGQVVPLGFSCGLSGIYIITAGNLGSFNAGTQIFLEDIRENNIQNLMTNPVYHFSYTAGEAAGRFLLHFSTTMIGTEDISTDRMQVYSWEDIVYVKHLNEGNVSGTVVIYDLTGKTVFSGKLENQPLNKFRPMVPDGLYMVKLQTARTFHTTKVFISHN
ncbi:MAG: T9SS type A sorting domain-containing protein [Bacteroidota bacterium]